MAEGRKIISSLPLDDLSTFAGAVFLAVASGARVPLNLTPASGRDAGFAAVWDLPSTIAPSNVITAGAGTGSVLSLGCAMRLRLASTTKLNVVFKASAAIRSTCKTGFSFLFLFMMPSSRRLRLVFLREGGGGGLRR